MPIYLLYMLFIREGFLVCPLQAGGGQTVAHLSQKHNLQCTIVHKDALIRKKLRLIKDRNLHVKARVGNLF